MSMRKPLLLQISSRHPEYLGMIEDHRERHVAYCKKWDYEYALLISEEVLDPWFRIKCMIEKMESKKFSHIFCLDGDVFIANLKHDLREALPAWAIYAATIHPYPWREQRVFHVQCGGYYMRSCQRSIKFLQEILSLRETASDDQSIVNRLLFYSPQSNWQKWFNVLPCEWNQTIQDCDFRMHNPIVAAFHGTQDVHGNSGPEFRRKLMLEVSKWYPYEDAE